MRLTYFMAGRTKEATQEIKTALELDPFSPTVHSTAAAIFIWTGEYEKAIMEARRVVEIDPSFAEGHTVLAGALGRNGAFEEGFTEWLRSLKLDGDSELAQELEAAEKKISGPGDPGRKLGHIALRYYQKKS